MNLYEQVRKDDILRKKVLKVFKWRMKRKHSKSCRDVHDIDGVQYSIRAHYLYESKIIKILAVKI